MKGRIAFAALGVAGLSTGALVVLEYVSSGGFPYGVPGAVFGFLAITSFATTAAALSALRIFPVSRFRGLLLIVAAAVAGSAWFTLFSDQLPCFLGGAGC